MASYRLSDTAKADIIDILAWTQERFGEAARLRYETLIVAAIRDIAENPSRPGSSGRPELGAGARSWHLRHSRDSVGTSVGVVRQPRHFIIFRIGPTGRPEIARILHDAMELQLRRPALRDWP